MALPFLLPGAPAALTAPGDSLHLCPRNSPGEGDSHTMGSPLTLLPAPAPYAPG